MDGIHDLGGKQGFGAIDVAEPEEPFHAEYEGRMWAITRTARAPDVGIDWWRHIRENIPAEDYLNRSYFDSWAQTEMAAMIDAGVFNMQELLSGVSNTKSVKGPPLLSYGQVIEQSASKATKFDRTVQQPPRFAIGDVIETNAVGHVGHTRLPAYARGKTGVIQAHHGAHIFPDAAARGQEMPQHLYTVVFTARELWGQDAPQNDTVSLELWEDYLGVA